MQWMLVIQSYVFSAFLMGCIQPGDAVAKSEITSDVIVLYAAPEAVEAADLNGDGYVELIVAAESLLVFTGDGTGRFSAAAHDAYSVGENPTDIAVGDINGDGYPDVAIANHETDYLTLLISDKNGNLTSHLQSPLQVAIDPHPHAVRLADMNNDGNLDLLTDNRRAPSIHIRYGDGRGDFAGKGVDINVGGDPYRGFALGDMDGNGWIDVITPNEADIAVVLRSDKGDELSIIPSPAPSAIEAIDVNGDGFLDILAASTTSQTSVFYGNGKGDFAEQKDSRFESGAGQAHKIAVGDFDMNGYGDAVIVGWDTPAITILNAGEKSIRRSVQATGPNPWALGIADVNGDGRDDIIVGSSGDRSVSIFLSPNSASSVNE